MQDLPIFLSKHTFFCLADNHYVFLNLHTDEYLCLGRVQTEEFRQMLEGQRPLDEGSPILKSLLDKGLFVREEADGKKPIPQRVDSVDTSLITNAADRPQPAIRPVHVRRFFAASARASWDLRFRPIESTVRRVERRKRAKLRRLAARRDLGLTAGRNGELAADRSRGPAKDRVSSLVADGSRKPADDETRVLADGRTATSATSAAGADVTELFSIFQALRPYYPRPYLCLFDSLALVHFLSRFDVFPEWVYGVKLEPWGAHCWVQHDNLVVNDIVDNVNGYTPIMSV